MEDAALHILVDISVNYSALNVVLSCAASVVNNMQIQTAHILSFKQTKKRFSL
jgi:hypothetical protein